MKITAVKDAKEAPRNENKIEKAQGIASEKLSDVAEVVHNKTDEAQGLLGEKVENAENVLRQKTSVVSEFTQQKLERANELGHKAADLIDSSSQYIKDFDAHETKEKVVKTLKRNPEYGFALVGAFGLLVGYLVGRKSKN